MQYSVDLEEIPTETRPLLSRANGEIRDAGDHMDDVFSFFDAGTDYITGEACPTTAARHVASDGKHKRKT